MINFYLYVSLFFIGFVMFCSVVGHVAIVDVTVGILINVLIGV